MATVRAASDQVLALVATAPDDAMVGTPFGQQTLDAYLRSRTAELVLHGMDLRTDVEVPAEALADCGAFLVERALGKGEGLAIVRALSGRGSLPSGFNVIDRQPHRHTSLTAGVGGACQRLTRQ